MEQKKKQADIPPDYVTLAQLQERWLKGQERKRKEKEEQNLQDKLLNQQQQKHQHEIELQQQEQRSKEVPHGSAALPRDGPRGFRCRIEHRRKEIKGDAVACPEEIDSGEAVVAAAAVLEEVKGGKETESDGQKKKKWTWKKIKKKDGKGNPRGVGEEEERTGSEEHAPKELRVERNKGGIQGRRLSRKKGEKQVEFRLRAVKSGVEGESNGTVSNAVEESDQTVENEIEIENVVGESDPAGEDDREIGNAVEESDKMVENVVGESVGGKLGELAIGGNGRLGERQWRVASRGNGGYSRPYNSGIYGINGCKRGAGGGRGDYGRYGGVNCGYWQVGSGYGGTNRFGQRRGKDDNGRMIWVRKAEVAHCGGDVAGNGKHSSEGISSKQMG